MVKKSTTEMDGLRDPMGNLVFIISGVDFSVLRSLSELLYTGTTNLDSEKSKQDLLDILSFELELKTLVGESTDNDVIAVTSHEPQNQDVFGTYLDLNCPPADKEDSEYLNKVIVNEQDFSGSDIVDKSHQTITEHMDDDLTSEFEALYEEVGQELEMTEPEEPIGQTEPGKTKGIGNSQQREQGKPQDNLLYQVSPSVPVPPVDPGLFEKGKTFVSFDDFQTKWDTYHRETHNKYTKYSRHKLHYNPTGRFPYKDIHYRCINYGVWSDAKSRGRGLRVHQRHNASNCKAEIKLLYKKEKQCYIVRSFHKDHTNHESADKHEFVCNKCNTIFKSARSLKFHMESNLVKSCIR